MCYYKKRSHPRASSRPRRRRERVVGRVHLRLPLGRRREGLCVDPRHGVAPFEEYDSPFIRTCGSAGVASSREIGELVVLAGELRRIRAFAGLAERAAWQGPPERVAGPVAELPKLGLLTPGSRADDHFARSPAHRRQHEARDENDERQRRVHSWFTALGGASSDWSVISGRILL